MLGSWKAPPARILTWYGSLRVRIILFTGSREAAPTHVLSCYCRLEILLYIHRRNLQGHCTLLRRNFRSRRSLLACSLSLLPSSSLRRVSPTDRRRAVSAAAVEVGELDKGGSFACLLAGTLKESKGGRTSRESGWDGLQLCLWPAGIGSTQLRGRSR